MTREEFVKMCTVFGIGLPFATTLTSCQNEEVNPDFNGKVLIIGAGAGGLSAGYFLQQRGIDFTILEASAQYGGRIRTNTEFTDFPIPLGAEWLETGTDIFTEIVNDSGVNVSVNTFADDPDRKFLNGSWLNFFEEYIVPSVSANISYNTIVESIDYSGDEIKITTQSGELTADKVIVSVPLKILQDGDIGFTPGLPNDKQEAIDDANVWEGFKAFFEFSEKFYDNDYEFSVSPSSDGEKIYYDAAKGQNSDKHILGLFVVGKPCEEFISKSGDELRDHILAELDALYDNKATSSYIKHITQDWTDEPFIKAGYLSDHENWRNVRELGESVDNKLYFAGGAYTDGEDWVSVHTAAQSARRAVDEFSV